MRLSLQAPELRVAAPWAQVTGSGGGRRLEEGREGGDTGRKCPSLVRASLSLKKADCGPQREAPSRRVRGPSPRQEGGRAEVRLQGLGSWASGQQMCVCWGGGRRGRGNRAGATSLCSLGLTEGGPRGRVLRAQGRERGEETRSKTKNGA